MSTAELREALTGVDESKLEDFNYLKELNETQIGAILNDQARPISLRMRVLWQLREMGSEQAIAELAKSLSDPSALLKHEVAYVMGQIGLPFAIPILHNVLKNAEEHPMVRHEAGEALGAIGTPECIELLRQYATDPCQEVAETCKLALDRISYMESNGQIDKPQAIEDEFTSVDPAPALETKDIKELTRVLNDQSLSLFERYRAMFALRNLSSSEAVQALCTAFADTSAVFKHELAFVLGQVQRDAGCIEVLTKVLSDPNENTMTRHEAAEALGSISAGRVLPLLKKLVSDEDRAVAESCMVAIDIHEYWQEFSRKAREAAEAAEAEAAAVSS